MVADPIFLGQIRAKILASGARVDSCILSTKAMCMIARGLGLRARPLTVETTIVNPVFATWIRARPLGTPIPDDVAYRLGDEGGRFVVVGDRTEPAKPGFWSGHLVAIVDSPYVTAPPRLIDLSIDQAHRPKKRINLTGPITFPVEHTEFLQGTAEAHYNLDDLLIVYVAHPNDNSYSDSPDWLRTDDVTVSF